MTDYNPMIPDQRDIAAAANANIPWWKYVGDVLTEVINPGFVKAGIEGGPKAGLTYAKEHPIETALDVIPSMKGLTGVAAITLPETIKAMKKLGWLEEEVRKLYDLAPRSIVTHIRNITRWPISGRRGEKVRQKEAAVRRMKRGSESITPVINSPSQVDVAVPHWKRQDVGIMDKKTRESLGMTGHRYPKLGVDPNFMKAHTLGTIVGESALDEIRKGHPEIYKELMGLITRGKGGPRSERIMSKAMMPQGVVSARGATRKWSGYFSPRLFTGDEVYDQANKIPQASADLWREAIGHVVADEMGLPNNAKRLPDVFNTKIRALLRKYGTPGTPEFNEKWGLHEDMMILGEHLRPFNKAQSELFARDVMSKARHTGKVSKKVGTDLYQAAKTVREAEKSLKEAGKLRDTYMSPLSADDVDAATDAIKKFMETE